MNHSADADVAATLAGTRCTLWVMCDSRQADRQIAAFHGSEWWVLKLCMTRSAGATSLTLTGTWCTLWVMCDSRQTDRQIAALHCMADDIHTL
jgi:hypothetical protein